MALPSGYKELEYIEGTGTQYINTGFNPNQNTRVIMDVRPIDVIMSRFWCSFGCRAGGRYFGLYKASSGNMNLTWFYGTNYSNYFTIDYTTRHIFEVNKNTAIVDGITKSYASQSFQISLPLYLFCDNDSGNPTSISSARIYSCKIYDNDNEIRRFVPCKNDLGDVGFWDEINSKFYSNAGTGVFVAGPVIDRSGIFVKVNGVWKQIDNVTVNVR